MTSGENEIECLERSLDNLRTAIQQTSRALPLGSPELASRRLIARLSKHLERAGLPLDGSSSNSLLGLVDLIFDDLMVGGDATSAVLEWRQGETADIDHERASILLELIP